MQVLSTVYLARWPYLCYILVPEFILVLATLFPIIHGLQTNAPWHIEVQQFLANNGNRHIDIIFNSSTDWIKFNTESVFWGKIPLASLEMTAERDSFGLFLFNTDKDDIGGYLSKICPRMVRSSLLVFAQPGGGHEVSLLREHLNKMSTEAFFYVAVRTSSSRSMSWYYVISLKSGHVIEPMAFAKDSYKIEEGYNLRGLKITSTSLPWDPFLTIEGCNDKGLECASHFGYLQDMIDIFAREFNFTLESHRNIVARWL